MEETKEVVALLQSLREDIARIQRARSEPRWLSISRAAKYSSLSTPAIRRLLSSGQLIPRRPVRGRVLVDRLELDQLIASATATPRRRRGVYDREKKS